MSPRALAIAALLAVSLPARAGSPDPWAPLRFLVGEWDATGGGNPGQGQGHFSFALDLGEKVLVRRAHSEYAGKEGSTVHDDLLVAQAEAGGLRARYWDNEGHVIDYQVAPSADGKRITFLSPSGGGPRYRLEYERLDADRVKVSFAVAPPGQPDAFKTYVEGEARRKAPGR